jgi:hypothetical protein
MQFSLDLISSRSLEMLREVLYTALWRCENLLIVNIDSTHLRTALWHNRDDKLGSFLCLSIWIMPEPFTPTTISWRYTSIATCTCFYIDSILGNESYRNSYKFHVILKAYIRYFSSHHLLIKKNGYSISLIKKLQAKDIILISPPI